MKPKILNPDRIRKINGSFGWIDHRFISDRFIELLSQQEILLYFFLVTVSNKYGVSFYSCEKICSILKISIDELITARESLSDNELILYKNGIYQVLDLPQDSLFTCRQK